MGVASANSNGLDINDGGSANAADNANLLLFSGGFMAAGGSAALLQNLNDDFADDGLINGVGSAGFTSIANASGAVNFMSNLHNKLQSHGVTDAPTEADLGALPVWVNQVQVPSTSPQNVTSTAGANSVTLTWDNVSGATAYDICQATENITAPESCSAHTGGSLLLDKTSPATIIGLTAGTQYHFVIIPKNTAGSGIASSGVTASPSSANRFNDTGITQCGDYGYDGGSGSHSNSANCTNAIDAESDPIPVGQDGHLGRDITHNDNSDGLAGFSFIKLDTSGVALTDQAITYTTTPWHCVKDKVTGLIWEVKTDDSGLHDKNDTYSWYNTGANSNGGRDGFENNGASTCFNYNNGDNATYCNTQAYVARVNAATWCGANDWRLPTRKELRSIVIYGSNPAIDMGYFPNTISSPFWLSLPNVNNNYNALVLKFSDGGDHSIDKSDSGPVRLVRSGQ